MAVRYIFLIVESARNTYVHSMNGSFTIKVPWHMFPLVQGPCLFNKFIISVA